MQRQIRPDARQRTIRLHQRTFAFAKRILDLCPRRYHDDPSRIVWRQLIQSASSASGILEEADEASSDGEFIYKMKSTLRETKESRRWLHFIAHCHLQRHQELGNLVDEARQLASIFAAIIRNTEQRIAEEKARTELRSRPRT